MMGPGWVGLRSRVLAVAFVAAGLSLPVAPAPASAAGGDQVTLAGTLRVVIADDLVRHRSQTRYYLETRRGSVRLVLPGGGPPDVTAGRATTVTGRRLANGMVRVERLAPAQGSAAAGDGSAATPDGSAAAGDGSAATPGGSATPDAAGAGVAPEASPPTLSEPLASAPAAASWPGPAIRRVAVVLGYYTDMPQPMATRAEAAEAMEGAGASVRTFFETASRGRTTVEATILGPWNFGIDSCDSYDTFTAVQEATEARAAADGINLSTFDHVIMWTRPPCGSGWMALGDAPGRYIHLSADFPDTGLGREYEFAATASHEMGHNMGLLHANSLRCSMAATPVPVGGSCAAEEYGDPYSVMGGDFGYRDTAANPPAYRFLSPLPDAAELDHLGWLDTGEATTASTAGTYHLVPVYGAGPGTRLLRVRRVPAVFATDPTTQWPMRSGWWTLELRSAPPPGSWDAFPPGLPARSGVILRYVEDGYDFSTVGWGHDLGSSFLVDMDPATVGTAADDPDLLDAPLEVGETFADPVTGTQITLTSLDAGGASVDVAFTGGQPPAAPVPGAAAITSTVPGSGAVTVAWSPPSTAGTYPPTGYTVRSYPGLEYCVAYVPATSCVVRGLANGTPYRFVVTYGIRDGYWVSSAPSAPVAPLAPPTASISPLAAYRATQSIPVAWSGSDHGAPVDSFDVRYRSAPWNGAFGSYAAWRSSTTAISATLTGGTGRTYCFSVRSRAGARTGAWSAEACTAVPLDDRTLTRSGGWNAITGSAYYRSTAVRASRTGSSLTRTGVRAKRIALVVSTCPTCGSLKVYWNGTYRKTISLGSTTTRHRVVVGALSFSAVRSGTLRLVVASSSRRVLVDGVAVSRR